MRARTGILAGWLTVVFAAGCAHEWDETKIIEVRAVGNGVVYSENTPIETKHPLRFQVRYAEDVVFKPEYSYDVLIGPDPFTSPAPTAVASFHSSRPTVEVQSGYGYLAGTWPMGGTGAVSASGDGTTLIVQVDGAISRVYLLRKSLLGSEFGRVELKSDPTKKKEMPTGKEEWYVETNAAGTDLLGPFEIKNAPAAIQNFVKKVKELACWADIKDACK